MIYDTLDHADSYAGLYPRLRDAFACLNQLTPETPNGRVEVDGENLFVNVERYRTVAPDTKRYEAHRRYLDIQILLAGSESIYVQSIDCLVETERYDSETDVAWYTGKTTPHISLQPGDFFLLLPQDGHKPGCWVEAGHPRDVIKAVAKVRID
ncbi:MAG: YhcH/YjgK/YiaL family protein [Planctomycetota bacterium]